MTYRREKLPGDERRNTKYGDIATYKLEAIDCANKIVQIRIYKIVNDELNSNLYVTMKSSARFWWEDFCLNFVEQLQAT